MIVEMTHFSTTRYGKPVPAISTILILLVFAPGSSPLASSVLLLIGDNHGGRVDKIMVYAPWFYIQLPSGAYTIVARLKNKVVLIRDVYVRENQRLKKMLGM
jgi:hypothetical protein